MFFWWEQDIGNNKLMVKGHAVKSVYQYCLVTPSQQIE